MKPEEEVIRIIKEHLTKDELARAIVFWDREVMGKGLPVTLGDETVEMPFNGTIAYADLKPGANLGHPFKCFLIDTARKNARVLDSMFPPNGQPHHFHVIIKRGKNMLKDEGS